MLSVLSLLWASTVLAQQKPAVQLFQVVRPDMKSTYVWEATFAEIAMWPIWKEGDEPPLSIVKAVKTAIASLSPEQKGTNWQVSSVRIQLPMEEDSRIDRRRAFFYVIGLEKPDDPILSTVDVVVTMHGVVLPSVTRPLPKGK
jgi:hypothetical protein